MAKRVEDPLEGTAMVVQQGAHRLPREQWTSGVQQHGAVPGDEEGGDQRRVFLRTVSVAGADAFSFPGESPPQLRSIDLSSTPESG